MVYAPAMSYDDVISRRFPRPLVRGGYIGGKGRPPLPTVGSGVKAAPPTHIVLETHNGSTSMIPLSSLRGPNPDAELQRHLTEALSVVLRHPSLTVDAGTPRLLAARRP